MGVCRSVSFLLNWIVSCRDAAGQHHLSDSWCQSPTGDFSLARKVTKRASKGLPLRYPLFKKSASLLFSALACRMGESFAPLPLISMETKKCSFPLVCLAGVVTPRHCSTRHSEEKAEMPTLTAEAGERGK